AIQDNFAKNLPGIIAAADFPVDVTVAWGPYVVVEPKDITKDHTATATNTMIVFKYPSQTVTGVNEYVVSIAGTKPTSIFDEINEDLLGGKIADWPYCPTPNNIRISHGTLNGINLLLGLNSANSITNFFSKLDDPNAIITVAGHSLGGALSPALALVLFGADTSYSDIPTHAKAQNWTTRTYALAGPDVGNSYYVNYLKTTFPPQAEPAVKWQQFNCKIWNSLDIVPQVWSKGFESYIDTIYGTQLNTPLAVKTILFGLNKMLLLNNDGSNPYICSDPDREGQFAGTFQKVLPANGPMIADDCSDSACSSTQKSIAECNFVGQILYQHINAYFEEIGVSAFLNAVTAGSKPTSVCSIKQKLLPL
ncbi:lipase family protein, partial [Chryseobacterium taichungense]|uniref:lipase family protein n=1 Tax=Chryseobacterium taichungense TaxID=295069 RepID=UPI0028AA6741